MISKYHISVKKKKKPDLFGEMASYRFGPEIYKMTLKYLYIPKSEEAKFTKVMSKGLRGQFKEDPIG